MRVRLKGINSITKKLADGTRRTYWYAWKGGPPLRGEPGTPEFVASYNEAVARKVVTPQGTLTSTLTDVFGFDASERRANVRSCGAGMLRSLSRSSAQHNRPSSRAEPGRASGPAFRSLRAVWP